jgi:hypothetical protein
MKHYTSKTQWPGLFLHGKYPTKNRPDHPAVVFLVELGHEQNWPNALS